MHFRNIPLFYLILHKQSWIWQMKECWQRLKINGSRKIATVKSWLGIILTVLLALRALVVFSITGIASMYALITFVTSFFYEHKHVLMAPNSGTSKWKRIRAMFKIFNEKKLGSHTYRTSRPLDNIVGAQDHPAIAVSPNINRSGSPQNYQVTNHTNATSVSSPEQIRHLMVNHLQKLFILMSLTSLWKNLQ